MKKLLIIFFLGTILIIGGAFYAGMKYGQSKFSLKTFQGFSPESRGEFLWQRRGRGFLSGEVIAKDGKSLTIKLPNGGTKIVFFSDSTQVSKTIEASINEIEIGKQIMVRGEENSDGTFTARTIQISLHPNLLEKQTQ